MVIYAVYVTVHLPCQELHVYWLFVGGGGGGSNLLYKFCISFIQNLGGGQYFWGAKKQTYTLKQMSTNITVQYSH